MHARKQNAIFSIVSAIIIGGNAILTLILFDLVKHGGCCWLYQTKILDDEPEMG